MREGDGCLIKILPNVSTAASRGVSGKAKARLLPISSFSENEYGAATQNVPSRFRSSFRAAVGGEGASLKTEGVRGERSGLERLREKDKTMSWSVSFCDNNPACRVLLAYGDPPSSRGSLTQLEPSPRHQIELSCLKPVPSHPVPVGRLS